MQALRPGEEDADLWPFVVGRGHLEQKAHLLRHTGLADCGVKPDSKIRSSLDGGAAGLRVSLLLSRRVPALQAGLEVDARASLGGN